MDFQPSAGKRTLHFNNTENQIITNSESRSDLIGWKIKKKSVYQDSILHDNVRLATPLPITTEPMISSASAMTLIPPYYETSFGNMSTPIYSPVRTIYPQPTFVHIPIIPVPIQLNPFLHSSCIFPPPSIYPVLTQQFLIPTTPVLSPIVSQGVVPNIPSIYDSPPSLYQSPASIYDDFSIPPSITSSVVDYYPSSYLDTTPSPSLDQSFTELRVTEPKINQEDPLAFYFELPPNLFYVPRSISAFDPNYFIDALCQLDNNTQDLSWILDLEFGHPRRWTQRALATYDVQSCNITCIDSSMTHPGFSRCSERLQKLLLFFYDSIISSWYIGFTEYYGDNSVKKFQDWLRPVMDVYGLCWRLRRV